VRHAMLVFSATAIRLLCWAARCSGWSLRAVVRLVSICCAPRRVRFSQLQPYGCICGRARGFL